MIEAESTVLTKVRKRSVNFLIVFTAVFTGGLIYIFFRPSKARFLWLANILGLEETVDRIRQSTLVLNLNIPEWVLYSLPDGLWAFAYTLIVVTIWMGNPLRIRYLWFATIPLLTLGFEVLQYTGTIGGTYSLADIFTIGAGILTGILTGKLTLRR